MNNTCPRLVKVGVISAIVITGETLRAFEKQLKIVGMGH